MTEHEWLQRVRTDLHLEGRQITGASSPATSSAEACPEPRCILSIHNRVFNHYDGTRNYTWETRTP